MELILLIIYSIIVWLIFFKFKLLPWNITSQVIVVTIPIIGLAAIILLLNVVAPSSADVRTMNFVVPVVPRVSGQVTEVPIEPNRPIKKGDVLFKIDPVPFQLNVKAAEAKLAELKVALITAEAAQRGLEDQLKNAAAKKAAIGARLELVKKRVDQFTQLASTGAGKRSDLEQAQADAANLESEILAADATESQVKQKLSARTAAGSPLVRSGWRLRTRSSRGWWRSAMSRSSRAYRRGRRASSTCRSPRCRRARQAGG